MSKNKKILKSTLIYSIGTFGSKILVFILLPIYSFFLTKEELGVYDLFLTTITLLIPIVTLQISQSVYRFLIEAKDDKKLIKQIISNSSIIFLVCLGITTVVITILFTIIEVNYNLYLLLMLFSGTFLPFSQQILRGLNKVFIYAFSGIVNTLLILILSYILLNFLNLGLAGVFISLIIANTTTFLFIFFKLKLYEFIDFSLYSKEKNIDFLKYSLPLIPNSISWWLINVANRYIILWTLGSSFNGLFAISVRFPSVITMISSIFILAWQDQIISNDKNDLKYSSSIFNNLIKGVLSLVIVLISLSKIIVDLLIDDKFSDSWKFMPILFIAVAFSCFSAFYGSIYLKLKKTSKIFTTTILGGITNLIVTYFLISKIGLHAASIGMFIGFLLVLILRIYDTRKNYKLKIDIKWLVGLLLTAFLFTYLLHYQNLIINFAMVVASLCIFILSNKTLISKGLKLLSSKISKKHIS